jgi:aminoglycoside 2''-phosphotransferase
MPNNSDRLLQRVIAIMPDLEIEQFEVDGGLFNEVAIVNRQFVCRFARDENAAAILQREMRLLDLIRPHLDVRIPDSIHHGPDYMVYPFLEGVNLTRKLVLASSLGEQAALAGQIGAFLYRLHSIDVSHADWEIPATLAPSERQNWVEIQARLKQSVYPLLMKSQIDWVDDLLEVALQDASFFQYARGLIHGDLAPYHILYDVRERKINAVIDFGVAGMGDPATDIAGLINFYGETFVLKIQPAYPGLEELLPRARFYAQAIELQWVLLGLENEDLSWFTAHLGGARDILG